jgi:hypothetical protein
MDEYMGLRLYRFTQLANGIVCSSAALFLHFFRIGVVVMAQTAPPQISYTENPIERIERHLEYDDKRLDEMEKSQSTFTGGAEALLGIIGTLSLLGFIRTPGKLVEKTERIIKP